MTSLRRRMLEDLQLRGLAPTTQQCYLDAVRQLAHHYRRPPDQLSDEEWRQYVLFLLKEKKVAERTCRIHLYGIRFLDERTLQRPWPVFELIRPRPRQTLPVVLSPQAVRARLAVVQRSKARMCLQMIYACGLRRREGTQLQVSDIDPQRRLVRVRQGKGGKDRLVPLAERPLELLRLSWQRARPRPWWFPARQQQAPRPATTLHKTFTRVVRQSGLAKDASVHTLRPSQATHLLERGVSLRIIQELLGHKSPSPTARYTPLTSQTFDVGHATINALRADLSPRWGMAMPAVADVFRDYGPAQQERFGADLLPSHRRAMDHMIHCRTEALGGQRLRCDHCGQEHQAYHSCRHRSCPKCHQHDTEGWLAARRQELLPVPYVPVVLTLPQDLRERVRRHQKDLQDMLLRSAAQALITLAKDPHDVGGLSGVLCVLHTWTRTLVYHPPVHGLVPAGGVSADRTEWRPARASYVVPVQALATLFRGLFLELVRQERPDLTLPESVWTKRWVGSCTPTVHGAEQVLNYLGRQVHRIALTTPRLLSIAAGPVSFRYQDAQDRCWRPMTLPADAFIRRFRQHVWPQGCHKVRYYGLWSPVHRPLLHHRQLGLAGHPAAPPPMAPEPAPQATDAWGPPLRAGQPCPSCGQGLLVVLRSIPRLQREPP